MNIFSFVPPLLHEVIYQVTMDFCLFALGYFNVYFPSIYYCLSLGLVNTKLSFSVGRHVAEEKRKMKKKVGRNKEWAVMEAEACLRKGNRTRIIERSLILVQSFEKLCLSLYFLYLLAVQWTDPSSNEAVVRLDRLIQFVAWQGCDRNGRVGCRRLGRVSHSVEPLPGKFQSGK